MSLLSAHLEQISFSCQGIDSLPCVNCRSISHLHSRLTLLSFPRPKIFTNALLSNHDITSLIRDTEAHERALFSVPPPPPPQIAPKKDPEPATAQPSKRRQTVFNVAGGEVTTGPPTTRRGAGPPRQHTAVAAVLGGDLHAQIVRAPAARRADDDGGGAANAKGDVDVEVLLAGAEKLCAVYSLPGAMERIAAQRQRCAHQGNTLAYYEARIKEQAEALGRMKEEHLFDESEEEADVVGGEVFTDEELRLEEEEVRELERKKRELQERLRAMDKDLGGLLNM
jgi:hypothetical protein